MMVPTPFTIALLVLLTGVQVNRPPWPDALTFHQSGSTGAIEGVVHLVGEGIPSATTVENATDPHVCGRQHGLEDLVVSPENRGIRYAIAALVGVPQDRLPERLPKRVVVDNRDCRFDPHVGVATVGDTIVTTNGDPTLHTTHYYGALRANISLPASGMGVSRLVRLPGMISILCDVHGWMKAFIRVDEHPYHAVTDQHGHFLISGIPPGSYTLELWHETLGMQRVSVRVEAGTRLRIDLEYTLAPEER